MHKNIVVIGNILRETVVYNNEIVGPVLGGPASYVSILLGRLGFDVGIITYVGDDLEKDMAAQFRSVDCSGMLKTSVTTENHLIYDQNEAISVEYTRTAPYITLDAIPKDYLDADKYFIGPMNYEVEPDILVYLKKNGKRVFTDLGGFGGTTSYNHFTYDSPRGKYLLDLICSCSEVVKASSDDIKLIYPGMTLEESFVHMLRDNVELAVVTLGRKGVAYQCRGEEIRYLPAFKPECAPEKINTVGGGDAVAAGILACYEGAESAREAVNYGLTLASLILEERGGCTESRVPTSVSVVKRLNRGVHY